jgi:predicted RNA-binding protein with RPS1 domain
MSLRDTYTKLRTTIVGVKTTNVDSKLDKAVKDIALYRSQANRNSYVNLIKHIISQTNNVNIDSGNQGLFGQGTTSPASFGQQMRLSRYKSYECIVSYINYCHRALSVLVDNILSPDDITKISLEIKPKTFLEDETDTNSKTSSVRETIDKLKLEKNLTTIVRNTLQYGDFFCEIADAKVAMTSRSIVAEGFLIKINDDESTRKSVMADILSWDQKINEKSSIKINLDFSTLQELVSDSKNGKINLHAEEGEKMDIDNLHLLFYEPYQVIKLQTEIFPVCFGYLVFPKVSITPGLAIQDEAINNICLSILQKIRTKIPEIKELGNAEKEIRSIIASMITNSDYSRSLNVRYVPPDKMQHFQVPSTKFYPYGESIFDSCMFTAKMIIAMETCLVVQRLSRSTEKRKVLIEIGLPRDAKHMIEKLREEMKKRKVSLDSFGTIDTIPSMISTFEDIYIPQKDGKPFVDIQSFTEGNVDTHSKTDEIKMLRDQLLGGLNIPPSYLGVEENMSNKASLSEESVLFARAIIHHQKYFSEQASELIQKIYNVISPEEALTLLDDIDISFSVPRALQFEQESKHLSDLANLIRTLEEIGIPREYSKKKYLTNIDWAEVEKYEVDQKIDKNLDPVIAAQDQGGMGMGGMGMGGMGGGLGGMGGGDMGGGFQ